VFGLSERKPTRGTRHGRRLLRPRCKTRGGVDPHGTSCLRERIEERGGHRQTDATTDALRDANRREGRAEVLRTHMREGGGRVVAWGIYINQQHGYSGWAVYVKGPRE